MRFEPAGRTENPEIPVAQSLVDYLFRWLASQFLTEDEKEHFGVLSPAVKAKLMAQEYGTPPAKTNGNGNGHPYSNTTTGQYTSTRPHTTGASERVDPTLCRFPEPGLVAGERPQWNRPVPGGGTTPFRG